jgi:hypothetical protein
MASFEGSLEMDDESMLNKIRTNCKDLKMLDVYLEKREVSSKARRIITQAIWCFEEITQHLKLNQVAASNDTNDASTLDESVVANPDPRQKNMESQNSSSDLFVLVSASELNKLRMNQTERSYSSTEDSKDSATKVERVRYRSVKKNDHQQEQKEPLLPRNKTPIKKVEAVRDRSVKEENNEMEFIREAVRKNMHFFLDGNTLKVQSEDPSEKQTKKDSYSKIVRFKTNHSG